MLEPPSEEERDVARTLQQLPKLMRASDRRAGILRWGARRKRSGPADEPPPPPPPPLSLRPRQDREEPPIKTEENIKTRESLEGTTTSPVSPLSFSPSTGEDTDSKNPAEATPLPPKPAPSKPSRQLNKWEQRIMALRQKEATLSAENANLKRSIEEMRSHHERLKASNSWLREKLLHESSETERCSSVDLLSVGATSYLQPMPDGRTHHPNPCHQHQPAWREAAAPALSALQQHLGWAAPERAHREAVLPDLNASVEEAELQQSAMRAAMSAQARKRRIEIQREKACNHTYRSSSPPSAEASPSPLPSLAYKTPPRFR